jgi:hypothetical protein
VIAMGRIPALEYGTLALENPEKINRQTLNKWGIKNLKNPVV